jgi:hypothetical protein
MIPERLLELRNKKIRFDNCPSESGMIPERELKERSKA